MHKPLQSHLKIALRLLRYLKASPGLGVMFSKGSSLVLTRFSDSDWGKCMSKRRCVTGFCLYLGSRLISCKSKQQSIVSKSSAEAEYRAMCMTGSDMVWVLKLLDDFQVRTSLPVTIHCDNNVALLISNNLVFHERTTHFKIDMFFLREKVMSGLFKNFKIDTGEQPAISLPRVLVFVSINTFVESCVFKTFLVIDLWVGVEICGSIFIHLPIQLL
jgi:hypothetical protein